MSPPPSFDHLNILHTIRREGFAPAEFTSAGGKREVLKLNINALMKKDAFAKSVGHELAAHYLRHIAATAPVLFVGTPDGDEQQLADAFNKGLESLGHAPLQTFIINKQHIGKHPGNGFSGFYKTGARALWLDGVLNHGSRARRAIENIRSQDKGMLISHMLCLVVRHPQSIANLAAAGVKVVPYLTIGQVLSPENAKSWEFFYGNPPYKEHRL